ncbi:purine/pyrimidine permease [Scopulibacillus cellulosilyticus]|uniref:Purine/pyrimidine permease n=1 Tax=Scopulibacillus cellulosilyticus TaxID=2665665 RepID=A0ABW2Q0P5_9BACL
MIRDYSKSGLSVFQWLIFFFVNSVAIPIVVGGIFHLSATEVTHLMQRTFLVVGLSTFLQGWIGHRMPIMDGPAGTWLGVFVIMGNMAVHKGHSFSDTLQILEGGMIIAGLMLFILGITGMIKRILTLFTPLVTGVFLFLLSIQLSGVFLKGMMNVNDISGKPDVIAFIIAFGVFLIIVGLSFWGRGWLRTFSLLIGISAGWLVFYLVGKGSPSPVSKEWIRIPEIFAWGYPRLDSGMALSALILAFMLVSNLVSNISAMGNVLSDGETKKKDFNRASSFAGITQILCSLFSVVGIVPLNSSVGYVRMTGQRCLRPFLIASIFLTGIALIPAIINFLSLLPAPIANAAMLATFVQSVGVALLSITKERLDERRLTILGLTLLFGIGVMFLPPAVFQGLPSIIQYVCGNGLLVGTMIVIIMEQVWVKKKEKPVKHQTNQNSTNIS